MGRALKLDAHFPMLQLLFEMIICFARFGEKGSSGIDKNYEEV